LTGFFWWGRLAEASGGAARQTVAVLSTQAIVPHGFQLDFRRRVVSNNPLYGQTIESTVKQIIEPNLSKLSAPSI
jgi:hypothetical protein